MLACRLLKIGIFLPGIRTFFRLHTNDDDSVHHQSNELATTPGVMDEVVPYRDRCLKRTRPLAQFLALGLTTAVDGSSFNVLVFLFFYKLVTLQFLFWGWI